jgi:1-acyl-sn-glycerol-3-phosphate acyltransferase
MGLLYSRAEGVRINYLMKKEWFFWPLKYFFHKTGGIPVYRDKNTNLTDTLAENAASSRFFRLCVTPEGTRKANSQWKKGFYFIAQKAGIPILLYGLDYERKLIECTKVIEPSGDIDKHLPEIQQYFKDYKGKHPENFEIQK